MKVILKGGSKEGNAKIEKFFMDKIFPILNFGIAIEPSDAVITVYKKQKDGTFDKFTDPTAEVIVELTEEVMNLAKDGDVSEAVLKQKSREFFDEAQAIQKIEDLHPLFSIEYYSCRYTPPLEDEPELDCEVHGSIEHMQSINGLCPGCGKR